MAGKQYLALSPQEQAISKRGNSKALSSVLADRRLATIVNALADCTHPDAPSITLEDGTVIVPTIREEIIYNALMKERSDGRGFQTVLDMQKVLGEAKEEVRVSVSLVDQDLMGRSLD